MSKLLIIGAKGFAKELLECVLQTTPETGITLYDDLDSSVAAKLFDRFPVLRTIDDAAHYFKSVDRRFALGVGSPDAREALFEKLVRAGGEPETVISRFAKIGELGNQVGEGVCVLADAVIESSNLIGKGALIHIGAFVSHDVTIGEFCEISPRANLLGGVTIGRKCRIGTASTILPGLAVGDSSVVGANAVVTKGVGPLTTVVGIPAGPISR